MQKPGRYVVGATKFSNVAPYICGSSVLNLLRVAFREHKILKWLLGFCKICVTSSATVKLGLAGSVRRVYNTAKVAPRSAVISIGTLYQEGVPGGATELLRYKPEGRWFDSR